MSKLASSARYAIGRHIEKTTPKRFQENEWGLRHAGVFLAWMERVDRPRHDVALARIIVGLAGYIDAHAEEFEYPVGHDHYLRFAVYQIFDALRHLLNGQTGDLDAGATLELLNELTRHAAIDYETGEPVYQEDNS